MQPQTSQSMVDTNDIEQWNVGVAEPLSFRWAIKPLEQGKVNAGGRTVPQSSDSHRGIIRDMNQYLFDYQEAQVAEGRDIDSITDGEAVHAVAQFNANHRDITKGNSLQWIGRNCRLIERDESMPPELYTKDEVESIKKNVEKRAYREGLRDGMKEDTE